MYEIAPFLEAAVADTIAFVISQFAYITFPRAGRSGADS